MLVDLVIYNGKIFFRHKLIEAGIAIDEGKIVKIAKKANLPPASKYRDIRGLLCLPGIIDAHVHLRGQGLSYKEDFFSGTSAAAAGGITTVLDMPNNQPLTVNAKSLKSRMKEASKDILVNLGFYSVFPRTLHEFQGIADQGAIAFKLVLSSPVTEINVDDDTTLIKAFQMAKEVGLPVVIHAEDRTFMNKMKKELIKRGRKDVMAFLEVHTSEVESYAISRIINLIRKMKIPVHFTHVSSAFGINIINMAKKSGVPITCDVTPHHLLLTFECLRRFGALALMNPPLRLNIDNMTLWKNVNQGVVDIVATDHAPHAIEEKKAKSIWDVRPGIPGLETFLPLMLTEVSNKRLSLSKLVKLTSENPSKIFQLKGKGKLEKGYDADITVVDMKKEAKIDPSKFKSKAKYTPFKGWKVRGLPILTIVGGTVAMEKGKIIANRGIGNIIKP